MKRWKPLAVAGVVVASVAVLVTSSLAATSAKHSSKSVTLVWWHNANQGAGLKLWNDVAKEYHATHPDVTIKRGRVRVERPAADEDPDRARVEQPAGRLPGMGRRRARRRGEGEARSQNITKYVKPWIKTIGGSAAGWQVNGQQYAVPYSVGVVGFWYNKTLFKQAGITSTPTTWPQFIAAVNKLKAANITPISVGGKDRWPDAFYWDYLATKICSKTTMQQSAVTYNFKDPCWLKAGAYVQQLLDAKPFQDGFLATPAQQVADELGRPARERQGRDGAAGSLERRA